MKPILKKIDQYRADKRNLFSSTEKIIAALICPDLYRELMPVDLQENPMRAYFSVLDGGQQRMVREYFLGTPKHTATYGDMATIPSESSQLNRV